MLFTPDLPEKKWIDFTAQGFNDPVCGMIQRGSGAGSQSTAAASHSPVCGLPLGGIDTGCLDLEVNGLLGFSSIFNALVPRRGPLNLPFLGLSVDANPSGKQTWICATLPMRNQGETILTWLNPSFASRYRRVRTAGEIHYWGHYPIADLEYILDGSPVSVGLRAWSPFIPGDVGASNTPGAVFEVHLRSLRESTLAEKNTVKGTLAFTFPGPSEAEAGTASFVRKEMTGVLQGVSVHSEQASYVLGVINPQPAAPMPVRAAGALGLESTAWAVIEHGLPLAVNQAGSTVAFDFTLEAGEEKVVRFVLAWHSPVWMGGGALTNGGNAYTHMYARRYPDAESVAHFLAENHASLLARILAWQSVVYNEQSLPSWLRDALVNILHLITEVSVWGQAKPPIGEWCREEDGLFGMSESPRFCPQIECIPCSFYGNLPLVYFFPELALSTLRGYKAYQFPSGQAPWVFGGVTVGTRPFELALPSMGYAVKPQTTLDGACYAEMVDKLWRRTGDQAILNEFYPSVKKNVIFTMALRPGAGAAGIVSMPENNNAYDWYELCDLFGIVPHIGGVHLAQLRLAHRMALAAGDVDFARQCQEWLEQGSAVLEDQAWTSGRGDGSKEHNSGGYYMLFNEPETGKRSDVILAHQLDGEWMARFHGLPGVFRPERVRTTLETLKRTSLSRSDTGAVVFSPPEGADEAGWDPGYWTLRGVHPPGTMMLSMLYLYMGQVDLGMDLAQRVVEEVYRRGQVWDWPVVIDGNEPQIGFDYYQNLVLWSLPAVISGGDLTSPCQPGGLVERILQAAHCGQ